MGDRVIAGDRDWRPAGVAPPRRRAADAAIDRTTLEARAAGNALRAETLRAFADLAAAQDRLRLADSLVAFTVRLDTTAARLLAVGEIAELDRNAMSIERATAAIGRLNAGSALGQARIGLAMLLGISPDTVIVAVREAPATTAASIDGTLARLAGVEAALASGSDTLLERRPEWQAGERELERLRAERSLGGLAWVPDINLGASIRSDRQVITASDIQGSDLVRNGFEKIDKKDKLLGIHVGVAVPLPFGGLYNAGEGDVAVADAEIALAEADRNTVAAGLRADLARAAMRLRAAAQALRLYGDAITPVVNRNRELLERGYREGELNATQVITQQAQLARIEELSIDAEREYAEALADFERAIAQ